MYLDFLVGVSLDAQTFQIAESSAAKNFQFGRSDFLSMSIPNTNTPTFREGMNSSLKLAFQMYSFSLAGYECPFQLPVLLGKLGRGYQHSSRLFGAKASKVHEMALRLAGEPKGLPRPADLACFKTDISKDLVPAHLKVQKYRMYRNVPRPSGWGAFWRLSSM